MSEGRAGAVTVMRPSLTVNGSRWKRWLKFIPCVAAGMPMSDTEAMDLMQKRTFQEKEEAAGKLQRAKLSSCQLPTYFVGWRGWLRVRDQYKQKQGVGAPLARLELRVALEQLLARTTGFELAGSTAPEAAYFLGGLSSLPLRFEASS